jgi:cytochrome c oxidase subunit 3
VASAGAFALALGGITYMHGGSMLWLIPGTRMRPLHDVRLVGRRHQGSQQGHHTRVVQLHLRYGMILFIASEVMFFVAWFWAFFDASLFRARHHVARDEFTGWDIGRRRASRCSIPGTCRCSTR